MKFVLSILCGLFFCSGLLISSNVSAEKQEKVPWGCDAYSSSTCYFSIHYSSGGNRNFTMRGGERDKISGVVPVKKVPPMARERVERVERRLAARQQLRRVYPPKGARTGYGQQVQTNIGG